MAAQRPHTHGTRYADCFILYISLVYGHVVITATAGDSRLQWTMRFIRHNLRHRCSFDDSAVYRDDSVYDISNWQVPLMGDRGKCAGDTVPCRVRVCDWTRAERVCVIAVYALFDIWWWVDDRCLCKMTSCLKRLISLKYARYSISRILDCDTLRPRPRECCFVGHQCVNNKFIYQQPGLESVLVFVIFR